MERVDDVMFMHKITASQRLASAVETANSAVASCVHTENDAGGKSSD